MKKPGFLRQDPDIILVGEIRDEETAREAFRAANTGHLVLSTLHANSAVEAVARLVDLGLEPYRVADTLIGVIAQRLIRILCPKCAVPSPVAHYSKVRQPSEEGCEN
ncbi:MAG: ATPase, T2SS/T4P/T4SS family, partial [Myxococcota bacterium]